MSLISYFVGVAALSVAIFLPAIGKSHMEEKLNENIPVESRKLFRDYDVDNNHKLDSEEFGKLTRSYEIKRVDLGGR